MSEVETIQEVRTDFEPQTLEEAFFGEPVEEQKPKRDLDGGITVSFSFDGKKWTIPELASVVMVRPINADDVCQVFRDYERELRRLGATGWCIADRSNQLTGYGIVEER